MQKYYLNFQQQEQLIMKKMPKQHYFVWIDYYCCYYYSNYLHLVVAVVEESIFVFLLRLHEQPLTTLRCRPHFHLQLRREERRE